MLLLADENFPGDAVRALREQGHDVVWACEEISGSSDEQLLALSLAENRVLMTFDKDFGELVFRAGRSASYGIILFRFRLKSPEFVRVMVLSVINSEVDWTKHFCVVEESRMRMRLLPD